MSEVTPVRVCLVCGTDMTGRRRDARLCSKPCRNAYRPQAASKKTRPQCTVTEDGERCTNAATHRLKTDPLCRKHRARVERSGSTELRMKHRPQGEVQARLRAAAVATTDACILLPSPVVGRLSVTLHSKPMTAARAVWTIAHGDPGTNQVLHTCHRGVDGCINVRHLYLGDVHQNMQDMVDADRSTRGERHGGHKLSEDQVHEIRRRSTRGVGRNVLARDYGVHPTTIYDVLRGRRWAWLTSLDSTK